jgi:periplasmic protein TonB
VQNLGIVSGNPLLNGAARDAVQQWRYKPTMRDGEPTEVITTITVTFTRSNWW